MDTNNTMKNQTLPLTVTTAHTPIQSPPTSWALRLGSRLTPRVGASLLLACLATAVQAEVVLSEVWVRSMPPSQHMTAGYGTISNTGSEAITITGGRSDIAKKVELHESVRDGDSVRMVAMGETTLAPGEQLELAPGGAHLMLMAIEQMPAADTTIELCLTLADAAESCVQAPVLRTAPKMKHDMSGHDHHSMQH